jgi:hypothetical protein
MLHKCRGKKTRDERWPSDDGRAGHLAQTDVSYTVSRN